LKLSYFKGGVAKRINIYGTTLFGLYCFELEWKAMDLPLFHRTKEVRCFDEYVGYAFQYQTFLKKLHQKDSLSFALHP